MAALRPTVLGHLDLITKLNAGSRFFDEDALRYRHAALEALHTADPHATLLEINTGGMARGSLKTPYPAALPPAGVARNGAGRFFSLLMPMLPPRCSMAMTRPRR